MGAALIAGGPSEGLAACSLAMQLVGTAAAAPYAGLALAYRAQLAGIRLFWLVLRGKRSIYLPWPLVLLVSLGAGEECGGVGAPVWKDCCAKSNRPTSCPRLRNRSSHSNRSSQCDQVAGTTTPPRQRAVQKCLSSRLTALGLLLRRRTSVPYSSRWACFASSPSSCCSPPPPGSMGLLLCSTVPARGRPHLPGPLPCWPRALPS
jgi:hypothetical protein